MLFCAKSAKSFMTTSVLNTPPQVETGDFDYPCTLAPDHIVKGQAKFQEKQRIKKSVARVCIIATLLLAIKSYFKL